MSKSKSLNVEQINEIAQQHAQTFFSMSTSAVNSILAMSKAVYEGYNSGTSKRAIFEKFCELTKIDRKSSTCRKYKVIGQNYDKLNEFVDHLPSNWTTLYKLSTVEAENLRIGVAEKLIVPNMTAKQLKEAFGKLNVPVTAGSIKARVSFSISIERQLPMESKARILDALQSLKNEGLHFGETLVSHLSDIETINV